MGKVMIGIIAVLVIMGIAAIYVMGGDNNTDINGNSVLGDSDNSNTGNSGEVRTFKLTGENFKFVMDGEDNPVLRVKEGDRVRIEFESTSGFHDWVVDEFNAATEQVRPGTPTFVEFVADEAGTYEYYCSVGEHRANGMFGTLIVE